MRKNILFVLTIILATALLFTSCTKATDNSAKPTQTEKTQTQEPTETQTPDASAEPTAEPTASPEPENEGPEKVVLSNSGDSTGNSQYAAAHYGLHTAYNGEYINLMNYDKLLVHGNDISFAPVLVEGFTYQAEDLQYHNGLLYFLVYDFDLGAYHMYSYDYENPPAKVTESTVYHYEFINGKIYFTKEFYQGPIYSMSIDGSGETELTQMRSHGFTTDGNMIYFYSTDAGTAPGIVEYNPSTNEETIVVFPFYSHNFIAHNGYIYYVYDGTYRSIHRVKISDQTVEDLWLEITDYTISLNISDGELYILSGYDIYKSNLDGSNRTKIFENTDSLQTGLYIFGNRIYATDGYSIIVIDRNDGTYHTFPMN